MLRDAMLGFAVCSRPRGTSFSVDAERPSRICYGWAHPPWLSRNEWIRALILWYRSRVGVTWKETRSNWYPRKRNFCFGISSNSLSWTRTPIMWQRLSTCTVSRRQWSWDGEKMSQSFMYWQRLMLIMCTSILISVIILVNTQDAGERPNSSVRNWYILSRVWNRRSFR